MCIYTEAIQKLDELSIKWGENISEKKAIKLGFSILPNFWKMVDEEIATKGVLFTLFTTSTERVIEGISFLPKDTIVHEHLHEAQEEKLTVITGELHYEVYEDDNGKKGRIVQKGVLTKWKSLNINPNEYHFLFTTNEDTYLHTKWIKHEESQKIF